ncbi:hypothetical protein ACFL2Q_00135 [Thermodesulfobacteriota bacterium]
MQEVIQQTASEKVIDPFESDTESLEALALVINRAQDQFDGHLTILRFTTGWKIIFDSPVKNYRALNHIPGFMHLREACEYALDHNTISPSYWS